MVPVSRTPGSPCSGIWERLRHNPQGRPHFWHQQAGVRGGSQATLRFDICWKEGLTECTEGRYVRGDGSLRDTS